MNTQRQDIFQECLIQQPAYIRKMYKQLDQATDEAIYNLREMNRLVIKALNTIIDSQERIINPKQ